MTRNKQAFIATLMATTLLTAGAVQAETPAPAQETPQQSAAEQDFGKVSKDGAGAYQDILRTRLAIFDGRIADAKKYAEAADTALGKAKTDDTVFTKAEADLKPPAGAAAHAVEKPTDQLKTAIAWLPVDGFIAINEDYTADPAKSAAVADANKSLKGGDRKAALSKLKLADIDVDVTLAIIPLRQTTSDVRQATDLIKGGKYYEASQILRQAENGERFDAADASATPETPVKTSAN